MNIQIELHRFLENEDKNNIELLIFILKKYYYNHEHPSKNEQQMLKHWFNLNDERETERFLSGVTDNEYDRLVEFIKLNNEVGSLPQNSHYKKCELGVFMGSINKIKTENDYKHWRSKCEGQHPSVVNEMLITEKLDGISALLTVTVEKSNINFKLCTRGNGKIGCDISHLVPYLKIGKQLDEVFNYCKKYDMKYPVNIRGELIIPKENDLDEKNLRNIVSGIVHVKDINDEVEHKLGLIDFVCYRIYDCNKTFSSQLVILSSMLFKMPQFTLLQHSENNFDKLKHTLDVFREYSQYEIDGIVISQNITNNRDPVDKNPEHSIALKNISETQQTEVIKVEWNVSKHGVYKPRIQIKPVCINGANIEWVTGFNAKFIKENKIGKGTILEIERSGDVIPNIKNVIKSTTSEFPTTEWNWNKTGVDICIKDTLEDSNEHVTCEMQQKKLLTFFQELECPNLGPKTIQTLYDNGFHTVLDILNLTKQDLLNIQKFKDKSSENVLLGIKVAKDFLANINSDNLYVLMYASGSFGFGFGSRKIKLILDEYPNIVEDYKENLRDLWITNLKNVKGILEQSEMFLDNINKYKIFIQSLQKYVKYTTKGVSTNNLNNNSTDKKGMIVMTGFRDKTLKQILENNGYVVNENITKETTIVIYNEDDSSSKCQKAKKMGIELISKSEVSNRLNI